MRAHPVAIKATAIQTPAPSSSARNPSRIAAIERSSMSDPALHGAFDDFLGTLRFCQLVGRREPSPDMDQLIHKSDEKNHQAARVAELRNPQRHRDDALRNVGKFPRLPSHDRGMPGEKTDEAGADEEGCDLHNMRDAGAET